MPCDTEILIVVLLAVVVNVDVFVVVDFSGAFVNAVPVARLSCWHMSMSGLDLLCSTVFHF